MGTDAKSKYDCPYCGYRISKEQRERVVIDFACPRCGKAKFSEFKCNKPIKEGEDKTYKSLKLFIGPKEAHDE